jgi:hypothetical protein
MYKFSVGKLKGRNPSGNLSVDGRIILKCSLKRQGARMWTGFSWLRTRVQWWAAVNMVRNLQVQ